MVLENRVFLTGTEGRTREVFAFDAGSGRLLWRRDLPGAPAGEVAWTSSIGVPGNRYGHASSPVLHEHRLLLQIDQGEAKQGKSRLVALDIFAGRKLWGTATPRARAVSL